MIRIPTSYTLQQGVAAMNERRAELARLQEQVTTGKRVNSPADDPLASGQAERARSQLARLQTERRMTDFARHMLSQADGAMASLADELNHARETLLSAGNGALGPAERALLAQELRGTRESLLALANQRDGAGGYVFGGQGTSIAPFAPDGTPATGTSGGEQLTGTQPAFTTSQDGRAVFGSPGGPAGGIFETLDKAIALLSDPGSTGSALQDGVKEALDGVDGGFERLLLARTRTGEQLRTLDARERLMDSGELAASGRLSDLVDADYASTISQVQSNQLAVEAAMATYARISRLSLFEYL